MLYTLYLNFIDSFPALNIFQYITFRMAGAMMTSLFMCMIVGRPFIRYLNRIQYGINNVREDTPEGHLAKIGTPSMGGILIISSILFSSLIWGNLHNMFVWIVLFVTVSFSLIGFSDDLLKIKRRNSKGLSGKLKLFFQILISFIAILLYQKCIGIELQNMLALPFAQNLLINISVLFIPFGILVIVGTSNAVNLTDGLDGLAIVPVIIALSCFAIISYVVGNQIYSNYLGVPYIQGSGELAIIAASIIGAGLGFLWFNAPPAMVFMGDTGSLSLGGTIGSIAVITKHEIVLSIIGGLFVLEAVSVILQVISFKMTGKRIFAMAPIHHHYEKKGWPESTIVIRFWIIAVILAVIGLSTLKLR